MSLPSLIIFENHLDPIPKAVLSGLMPQLATLGYDTFALEVDKNLSFHDFRKLHNEGLKEASELLETSNTYLRGAGIAKDLTAETLFSLGELLRRHVSSQHYMEIAEKIKQIPNSKSLKEILDQAEKFSISLDGVEEGPIIQDIYDAANISARVRKIKAIEPLRIAKIFENLLTLHIERQGVIFSCGASHAQDLLQAFDRSEMRGRFVCYFPHTPIEQLIAPEAKDLPTTELQSLFPKDLHPLSREEIPPFSQRIIEEIKKKITYKKEVLEQTSQSRLLGDLFPGCFRLFLRQGHAVDAITESADIETIEKRLSEEEVPCYRKLLQGRTHLVIPSVNTEKIARKLLSL